MRICDLIERLEAISEDHRFAPVFIDIPEGTPTGTYLLSWAGKDDLDASSDSADEQEALFLHPGLRVQLFQDGKPRVR